MARKYYSSRNKPKSISLEDLFLKLKNLFSLFENQDYFKEKAGITRQNIPDNIKYEAAIALNFQPFPIDRWYIEDLTEDNIFDVIEFLYDYVSMPGDLVGMTTDTGWDYMDYDSYDGEAGRIEFRGKANLFLCNYGPGYELTEDGFILALGQDGLQHILEAEIIPYDEIHVDNKVRDAIIKWRNRHLSLSEKKEAIRELSDVFEWLKQSKELAAVLDGKDVSTIFDIANNFGLRHHNPSQKTNYDKTIWYSWMFHFYLATYHAVVRMLIKKEKEESQNQET